MVQGNSATILKDFRNAPFYIQCLFHIADLSMFPFTQWSMICDKFYLLICSCCHAVYSDVISTLVFFINFRLTNVSLIQLENKHVMLVA